MSTDRTWCLTDRTGQRIASAARSRPLAKVRAAAGWGGEWGLERPVHAFPRARWRSVGHREGDERSGRPAFCRNPDRWRSSSVRITWSPKNFSFPLLRVGKRPGRQGIRRALSSRNADRCLEVCACTRQHRDRRHRRSQEIRCHTGEVLERSGREGIGAESVQRCMAALGVARVDVHAPNDRTTCSVRQRLLTRNGRVVGHDAYPAPRTL